jgi:hypothetical protein
MRVSYLLNWRIMFIGGYYLHSFMWQVAQVGIAETNCWVFFNQHNVIQPRTLHVFLMYFSCISHVFIKNYKKSSKISMYFSCIFHVFWTPIGKILKVKKLHFRYYLTYISCIYELVQPRQGKKVSRRRLNEAEKNKLKNIPSR